MFFCFPYCRFGALGGSYVLDGPEQFHEIAASVIYSLGLGMHMADRPVSPDNFYSIFTSLPISPISLIILHTRSRFRQIACRYSSKPGSHSLRLSLSPGYCKTHRTSTFYPLADHDTRSQSVQCAVPGLCGTRFRLIFFIRL